MPTSSNLLILTLLLLTTSTLTDVTLAASFALGPGLSSSDMFYAECSPANTIGVYFNVDKLNATVASIQLLPKRGYDELVAKWNAGQRGITPDTGSVGSYGCWPNVTRCQKDTGPILAADTYCVTVLKHPEASGVTGTVTRTFGTQKGSASSSSDSGLDGGAIAGIVIGVLVLVFIVGGVLHAKLKAPPTTTRFPQRPVDSMTMRSVNSKHASIAIPPVNGPSSSKTQIGTANAVSKPQSPPSSIVGSSTQPTVNPASVPFYPSGVGSYPPSVSYTQYPNAYMDPSMTGSGPGMYSPYSPYSTNTHVMDYSTTMSPPQGLDSMLSYPEGETNEQGRFVQGGHEQIRRPMT